VTLVSGAASVVLEAGQTCDPGPYLREKKAKKYLGLQDALAVVAAGRALEASGLTLEPERTGLYLAVGYIPALERDFLPVLEGSLDAEGRFSLERFAAEGYLRAHPLLAFRCLPNMPAYHVASSFGIEGPYSVLYPGAGELYLALEEATSALERGDIDVALVVGVAHQRNFLVEHHMLRLVPPVPPSLLRDAAAAFVLERDGKPRGRAARLRLESLDVAYETHDCLSTVPAAGATITRDGERTILQGDVGPADPLVAVEDAIGAGATLVEHELFARNGVRAVSRWRAL
jgi:hypothetical protein